MNTARFTLRIVALAPALIGVTVLGAAALFLMVSLRESLWVLLAISVALAVCAVILLRCTWLSWRRPSPLTVREVCDWTGFLLIGIALLSVERLHAAGQDWLAWAALVMSVLVVAALQRWLTRVLLRRLFGGADWRRA